MIPNVLPAPLDQYAKAIYPFVLSALTVGVNHLFGDPLDLDALRVAALGVITATLTFLVPNAAQGD